MRVQYNADKGAREDLMIKVKTFGVDIRPMKTMRELADLDQMINSFISENNIKKVISVSDAATTDDRGETIGLIRVLCYEA
ncbi:MAG TPA: hypothetical protein DCP92_02115 [Nitrospiraceae bacterium]|jgi:hypothetical protein|nr:hypothetical protein [Nitrospiraceae bacterium]